MRVRRPIRRSIVVLVGAVVAASTAGPAALAASAGPAAPGAAGGLVHFYLVNTALNPTTPNTVLVTGAFSDHGTGQGGTWHLTKGSIVIDASKLKAITNSANSGTFYPASCSFQGVASATVTLVSGTGAYAGITGRILATETVAAQGSLLKNGKCNEANNAPSVAEALIVTGSGTVSFK